MADPPASGSMIGRWRGDTLVGAGTATAWNDMTGNGNHLTASGSPTIVASEYFGRTVARLNRASTQYFFTNAFNRAQPYTVVFIGKCTVGDGEPHLFDGHSTANASAAYHANNGDGDMIALFAGADLYGTQLPGDWHTYQILMNGASSTIYIDNVLDVSGDPGSTGLTGFRVGNWRSTAGSPNRAWHGDIAEVILYNKALNGTERTELAAYVAEYYSDTNATTGTPTSQSSTLAGTVGVTVNADGALTSQAAQVAGAVTVIATEFTGDLDAQSADIAGSVGITISVAGTLAAAAATLAGTAGVTVNADGAIEAPDATIAGEFTGEEVATIEATGALNTTSPTLMGVVDPLVEAEGELAVDAATIEGEYSTETIEITGSIEAQDAEVSGEVDATITVDAAIQAEDASLELEIPTPLPTITFTSTMQAGIASMSGIYSRVKQDRSDIYMVRQGHRLRFQVRVR